MSEGPPSKIVNFQYKNQVADLIHAHPTGPIEGYHRNNDSENQSWYITVVGGNHITIKNVATGSYASVPKEYEKAKVVGSPKPYTWQQNPITVGFQIATLDGQFAWFLSGPNDYDPIQLKGTSYHGNDAQWGYDPAK